MRHVDWHVADATAEKGFEYGLVDVSNLEKLVGSALRDATKRMCAQAALDGEGVAKQRVLLALETCTPVVSVLEALLHTDVT